MWYWYRGAMEDTARGESKRRKQLRRIIFGTDTPGGKAFDVGLLWAILLSIAAVMLESVVHYRQHWGAQLYAAEWFFTVLFTAEYAARLWCVHRPAHYAMSFFGIVDLLSILPSYITLATGAPSLAVVRSLRLLRVFRVLRLRHYMTEANVLSDAIRATMPKITVFLGTVVVVVTIMGSLMYIVEGPEHGFTSIPRGVYWAIVTVTTVGYGDIHPETALGQALSSMLMVLGYAIIAVPTGIVTVQLAEANRLADERRNCIDCGVHGHDPDANHCKHCGGTVADSKALASLRPPEDDMS